MRVGHDHREVSKVFGTLLTMWKAFHYSPKKAEKLIEIQAILNSPELKVTKNPVTQDGWQGSGVFVPSGNVCLLLFVRLRNSMEMLRHMGYRGCYVHTRLLHVCICYVISSTVAKLQASLQAKDLDLASVPVLVDSTLSRLIELKENPSSTTWFKDHRNVFTDSNLLGERNIYRASGFSGNGRKRKRKRTRKRKRKRKSRQNCTFYGMGRQSCKYIARPVQVLHEHPPPTWIVTTLSHTHQGHLHIV